MLKARGGRGNLGGAGHGHGEVQGEEDGVGQEVETEKGPCMQ